MGSPQKGDTSILSDEEECLSSTTSREATSYDLKDGEGDSDDAGPASHQITLEEAVRHFKSIGLYKDPLKTPNEKSKLGDLLKWMRNIPKLETSLTSEADLIHALTQHGLDWNDSIHVGILGSVYLGLTQESDCPLQRGPHWQRIGFQGSDPSSDLRGVGLFGLLQMLALTSSEYLGLGRSLYRVSQSSDQPFPLAVLSLNVTHITLSLFNEGKLNRECNAQKSVITTLNSFYGAVLVFVLHVWVTQKKTIKDSGYLLKDAERYCGRNVRRVLKDLPQKLQKYELS